MAGNLGAIQELAGNVERFAGKQVRDEVMQGSDPLKESTKPDKLAAWVQGAMQRLDALVDEPTRRQIMGECGYNCARVNSRPLKAALARRARFASLDELLAAEQAKPPPGMRLSREGEYLYQVYTPRAFSHPMRCYCSLLRGLPQGETTSRTYCQCSRAFVQRYWEAILGKPVEVELLHSAVAGADQCGFKIRL